jgi:hypothetical protein
MQREASFLPARLRGPLLDRITGRERHRRNRKRGQAEEPIAAQLAELAGEGYRVLRHVQAGRNRIDQLIVGPTGVYVVRVNTWQGRFSIRRDGWFQHTRGDAGELVWDVAQQVMAVKALLRSKGLLGQVHGLVAVTRSSMPEPVIHMGRVTFVDGPSVLRYVTSRRPSLSEEITQAAAGIPA